MAARAVGGTGAAAGIEYRVLGSLEVRRGGRALALGGSKQRALLAVLLLNANRVVSRDRLIDELWGDDPPQTAVVRLKELQMQYPGSDLKVGACTAS